MHRQSTSTAASTTASTSSQKGDEGVSGPNNVIVTHATTTTSVPSSNSTGDEDAIVIGLSVAITVTVAILLGVGFWCVRLQFMRRKILMKRVRGATQEMSTLPLINSVNNSDAHTETFEKTLARLSQNLNKSSHAPQWSIVESMARDYEALLSLPCDSDERIRAARADAMPIFNLVSQVLRRALTEQQTLLDATIAEREYAQMAFYAERVKTLSRQLESGNSLDFAPSQSGFDDDGPRLECVVPGLLLQKDRFEGTSAAFLGRGASAAVSRGIFLEMIGSTEVRTVVAVKEVPKTGASSEKQAMRELLLLKKKIRERHPNIIHVFAVRSSSSMFYVIMQCCNFSLDKQPADFQQFLHASRGDRPAPKSGRWRSSTTNMSGRIVLNALVQDLVKALAFLHRKHIMHCDIKVCEVKYLQVPNNCCFPRIHNLSLSLPLDVQFIRRTIMLHIAARKSPCVIE